jgi:UDP-4-keto-D-FucNAc 4-reductase
MPDRPLALVTGAGGFVGSHVVQALVMRGFDVRAVRRQRPVARRPHVSVIDSDLTDLSQCGPLLRDVDVVIHLAARAHVFRQSDRDADVAYDRVNTTATAQLASAAVAHGVRRFVFLSTIGVHGDRSDGDKRIDETSPLLPQTPYARSKLRAEQRLADLQDAIETTVLRVPLVYGTGAPGNLRRLSHAIERGMPLPLAGIRNRRSLIGVESLAELISISARHSAAAGATFVASDLSAVSTPQIVTALAHALGRTPRLFRVPTAMLRISAVAFRRQPLYSSLCESLIVNPFRAADVLGWRGESDTLAGLRSAFVPRRSDVDAPSTSH